MQEQRAKLITSDNTEEKYAVLLDQEIGRGGFGVVYRAIDMNNKQDRLVVKVVPLEGTRREMIEGELRILHELPPHANLVRVRPIKCYSESNYYILMEYCRDGTLLDQLKAKKTFSEQEVLNTFYQIVKGYKVLFDKKILHQDLKPDNVLIDRGVYKLADFGLSIFYEGYKYTNKREGTLNYIAPQKLTKLDYKGNPLSDVFSMGVIFYQLVLGRHPYIRTQGKKELKSFLQQIKQAKLTLPLGFSNNHSLKFLEFFDLILRMLTKTETERITFEQIWNYVQTSENFESARRAQQEKSRQHVLSEYNLVVSEVSKVLTIPMETPELEEKDIREKILVEKKQEREEVDLNTAKLLASYILDRRIVIYFLDRLARRLIVEQLKKGQRTSLYDSVIFQLLLLTRTIVNQVIHETRNPKRFTLTDWKKLKVNQEHKVLLEIVARDEGYIEDITCDFLAEDSQLTKKQLRDLFQIYKGTDIKAQLEVLRQSIIKLIADKAKYVEAQTIPLATIVYLEEAERVVADLPAAILRAAQLEKLIHDIETDTMDHLRKSVQETCTRYNLVSMMEIPEIQEDVGQVAKLIN